MISVRRISFDEFLNDSAYDEIVSGYARECANLGLETKPDHVFYRRAVDSGLALLLGVFTTDALVGVAVVLVSEHPHYSKKLAVVESLYVLPDARIRGAGSAILEAIKDEARKAGAEGVLVSAPTGSRLEKLGRLCEWRQTNSVFFLEL